MSNIVRRWTSGVKSISDIYQLRKFNFADDSQSRQREKCTRVNNDSPKDTTTTFWSTPEYLKELSVQYHKSALNKPIAINFTNPLCKIDLCSHRMPNKPTAFHRNLHDQHERRLVVALRKTWSILRLPVRGRTRLEGKSNWEVILIKPRAYSIYCCQPDTCNRRRWQLMSVDDRLTLTHLISWDVHSTTSHPREQPQVALSNHPTQPDARVESMLYKFSCIWHPQFLTRTSRWRYHYV